MLRIPESSLSPPRSIADALNDLMLSIQTVHAIVALIDDAVSDGMQFSGENGSERAVMVAGRARHVKHSLALADELLERVSLELRPVLEAATAAERAGGPK